MDILIVSYRLAYPTVRHAGGVYQFELIKKLGELGHRVDLLSFVDSSEEPFVHEIEPYCQSVTAVPYTKRPLERFGSIIRYLFYPKFIAEVFRRSFVRALRLVAAAKKYDLVHFEYIQIAQYEKYVKGIPKTLLEHDISVKPIKRDFEQQERILLKARKWITLRQITRYEPRVCTLFDLVVVFSPSDKEYLQAYLDENRIHVLKPPAPKTQKRKDEGAPKNKDILFLGNLARRPNIESVVWFYNHVFTDIYKNHPDARFVVVGSNPAEQLLELSTRPGVHLEADVEDIEHYYKESRVFVSPLFIGGGIIKKNLDSMAYGCPVVTTSIGDEGIGAAGVKGVWIADTAQEFLRAVEKICSDDAVWLSIVERGQTFIEDEFDWHENVKNLSAAFSSLD